MKSPSIDRKIPKIRSISIVTNPEKVSAHEELVLLRKWLRSRGIRTCPTNKLSEADAVITLGGDGTILSIAAQAALSGIPVLGVNIGRLGFMTSIELGRMYEALDDVLARKWIVSDRLMLEVTVPGHRGPHLALNDAVIRIGTATRVTMVNAMIEEEDLGCFTGDGVIVATPTGSTAYSLAAQGPIVNPEMEALVLTPICAHSFTQRPVVFSSQHVITLWSKDPRAGNQLQLTLDGQRVFKLKPDDRVVVRRSRHKLKLLQNPNVTYFGVLREKLSWGGR